MDIENESHAMKNPFFALAHLSREQLLAMPEKKLRELAEQFGIIAPDYDPDAPVEKRIGWLMEKGGE